MIEIAPKSTEIQDDWDSARLYCFSLNIDGKIGWRLPTRKELYQIYQSDNDFEKAWYWSDAEYDVNYAWTQNMSYGSQNANSWKKNGGYYVRSVRSTF